MNPAKKAEVICSKYIVQYLFGAGSSAAIVPLIDAIGVGWSFTFCKSLHVKLACKTLTAAILVVALDFIGGGLVLIITRFWTKVSEESGGV